MLTLGTETTNKAPIAALPIATTVIQNDWWQDTIFYQIYPRSFMDSNGDGVGDLKGIISKLGYLAETGITAVWLNPIFKSPMIDFGYDISDFKAIHEEYGTMQDFEQVIVEANKLDIKIILDFVPNHSSDQCEWFQQSAKRNEVYENFYIWANARINQNGERQPPNNWRSVFGGSAWTWHELRQQYYLHQFTSQQPDLNFRNSKVVEAMDNVMLFWLNKGVSGFRIDAVNHLFESSNYEDEPLSGTTDDISSYEYTKHIYTKDLPEVYDMLHHWRMLLDDYSTANIGGPKRIMMTEAYAELKVLMDYYENKTKVRGAHFPFNFMFISSLTKESDARDFVFEIQKWMTFMPVGCTANWILGNHDNPRVASRFGPERIDAMNMLLMTLPGVAVTYNGEEIGMEDYLDITWEQTVDPPACNAGPQNYKKLSRDPERTPFQWNATKNAGFSAAKKTWLPVHPNYERLNLAQQQLATRSHYKVYKALVSIKKSPTLRKGRMHIEVVNRDVFAFKRTLKGHASVITVINTSAAEQCVDLTKLFKVSPELNVVIAGIDSLYEKGSKVMACALKFVPYEGVVCMS